jgi:predicted DNA-binding mobile mystery protein A
MRYDFNDISFIQKSRRLEELRTINEKSNIRGGWIKFMRKALGMGLNHLSQLSATSISTINQSEKREEQGRVTLSTLRKFAEAMDCELVYSFVPKKDLKTLIKEKAFAKARRSLLRADHHMKLEAQKVEGDIEAQIERLAHKLMNKGDIW